jgi:hypothetical protein
MSETPHPDNMLEALEQRAGQQSCPDESEGDDEDQDEAMPNLPVRKKTTQLEKQERIDRAIELLSQIPYGKAWRVFAEEYNVQERTAKWYLQMGKEKMLETLNITREQHRSQAYHELQTLITKEGVRNADRLKAIHLKMSLLGLRVPIKLEVANISPEYNPENQHRLLQNPTLLALVQRADELLQSNANPVESPPTETTSPDTNRAG